MLTPNGGVFGRNPTFNNVTVENNLTVNGDFTLGDDIVINDTLLVNGQATFRGGIISIPNSSAPTSNAVLGSTAGASLQSGAADNVLIGSAAGDAITTGDQSVAIGTDALGSNQTANNCVAIGHAALALGTSADNVAVGANALDANTTGTRNVAIGKDAGGAITTGSACTAIGWNALLANTTTSGNIAIGDRALSTCTTAAADCVAIGVRALEAHTSGSTNVAIGTQSAFSLNAAGQASITALGGFSLLNATSASISTAIGGSAARRIADGTNCTSVDSSVFVGFDTRPAGNSQTNQIVIGNSAIGNGSNTATIGNSSITATYLRGASTFSVGENGQATRLGQATTLLSALSGATVTATNLIPANCILLGVTARVTTAITGATTFDIGDGTTADRFGNDVAIAVDTTSNQVIAPAAFTTANNVVLTANGSNFTGGAVRLTAHFMTLVAPTS